MGRYVCKGEKGIPILAPILISSEDENGEKVEQLVGFKAVYVFDISQTDGEPLPDPPDWKSSEQNAKLSKCLMRFADNNNIIIEVKDLAGETQGAVFSELFSGWPDHGRS